MLSRPYGTGLGGWGGWARLAVARAPLGRAEISGTRALEGSRAYCVSTWGGGKGGRIYYYNALGLAM